MKTFLIHIKRHYAYGGINKLLIYQLVVLNFPNRIIGKTNIYAEVMYYDQIITVMINVTLYMIYIACKCKEHFFLKRLILRVGFLWKLCLPEVNIKEDRPLLFIYISPSKCQKYLSEPLYLQVIYVRYLYWYKKK